MTVHNISADLQQANLLCQSLEKAGVKKGGMQEVKDLTLVQGPNGPIFETTGILKRVMDFFRSRGSSSQTEDTLELAKRLSKEFPIEDAVKMGEVAKKLGIAPDELQKRAEVLHNCLAQLEIQNAYRLCDTLVRAGGAEKRGQLVGGKGGTLKFVGRFTVRGLFNRVVGFFAKKRNVEAMDNKLDRAVKLYQAFQALPLGDNEAMNRLAQSLGIKGETSTKGPGDVLKERVAELGLYLKTLDDRVSRLRGDLIRSGKIEKSQESAPKQRQFVILEKAPISASKILEITQRSGHVEVYEDIARLRMVHGITGKEADIVVSCIVASGKKDDLKNADDKLQVVLDTLRSFLPRTPSEASAVRRILQKLSTEKATEGQAPLLLMQQEPARVAESFLEKSLHVVPISDIKNIQDLRLNTQPSCLILGGYKGHPMVYEITRGEEGKYKVKIYGEEGCTGKLPYAEITVAENALFHGKAWEGLKWLAGMVSIGMTPSLIQLLQGLEHLDPQKAQEVFGSLVGDDGRQLIRPDVPGVSCARALVVAMAPGQGDDFEETVLQTSIPSIQHLLEKEVETKEEYRELVGEMKALRSAFKESERRLSHKPSSRAVLQFREYMGRLEEKLLQAQEKLFTSSSMTGEGGQPVPLSQPKRVQVPKEAGFERVALQPRLMQEERSLLQNVRKGAPPDQLLRELSEIEATSPEYNYVCDQVLQRLGSIEEIQEIRFSSPQETLIQMRRVIHNLSSQIDASTPTGSRSELYGMLLKATLIFEQAARQCDPALCPVGSFSSILTSPEIQEQVARLRTSDPHWASFFQELRHMPSTQMAGTQMAGTQMQRSGPLLFQFSLEGGLISLDSFPVSAIASWFRGRPSGLQGDMREKIRESIAADRAEQARVITERKTEEKRKLEFHKKEQARNQELITKKKREIKVFLTDVEKLEKEKKTLGGGGGYIPRYFTRSKEKDSGRIDQINAHLRRLQGQIKTAGKELDQLKETKGELHHKILESEKLINGGIEKEVHADPQYWPWGVGNDESPQWEDRQLAAYLLAGGKELFQKKLGQEDVLPDLFRSFCDISLCARNIFAKREGPFLAGEEQQVGGAGAPHLQLEERNDGFKVSGISAPFRQSGERHDVYFEGFRNKELAKLYQHVLCEDFVEELAIPRIVTVGVENRGGAEQTKAPSQLWSFFRKKWPEKVKLHDELRELCQLHCSQEMQIDSTISYFKENPQKLYTYDGRLLFHALLFESDLLVQALQNKETGPLVAERLRELFNKIIESALTVMGPESLDACANIIWLASCVQSQLKSQNVQAEDIVSSETICKVMDAFANEKYRDQWPLLFEACEAAVGRALTGPIDSPVKEKLFVYGLLARAFANEEGVAIPQEQMVSLRAQDAALGNLRLREILLTITPQRALELFNTHGGGLIDRVYPALGQTFSEIDDGYVLTSANKSTELSLTEGIFSSQDPNLRRQYTRAITPETSAVLLRSGLYHDQKELASLRCYVEGGVVCILDKQRGLQLKVQNGNVYVAATIDRTPIWCLHCEGNKKQAVGNNALYNNYHQWVDPEGKKTYLVDKTTLQPVFATDGTGRIVKITTGQVLVSEPEESVFKGFEAGTCSLYWGNETNEIQEVHLPRLGMVFERKGKTFSLQGSPEWVVSSKQFIPGMERESGFLVLENEVTKETKVLLPTCGIALDGSYDFREAEPRLGTVECSFSRGVLTPKTLEGRYQLAKMYLADGAFEQAERLLFSRQADLTSRKFSSEEAKQLEEIAFRNIQENEGPQSIRLKMHALYLLKRNEEQFPKEALVEEQRMLRAPTLEDAQREITLARAYLGSMSASMSGPWALPREEELFLLRSVSSSKEKESQIEAQKNSPLAHRYEFYDECRLRLTSLEQEEVSRLTSITLPFGCYLVATALAGNVSEQQRHLLLSCQVDHISRQFSPEEVQQLKKIVYSPVLETEDAQLIRFKMRALYLLKRNEMQFQAKGADKELSAQNALLQAQNEVALSEAYLKDASKDLSSPWTLSREEELFLLRSISDAPRIDTASSKERETFESTESVLGTRYKFYVDSKKRRALLERSEIGLEDRGVTRKLREEFFEKIIAEKKEDKEAELVGKKLFPETSVEVKEGDTVAGAKFSQLKDDLTVAEKTLGEDQYTLRSDMKLDVLEIRLQQEYDRESAFLANTEELILGRVLQLLSRDPKRAQAYAEGSRLTPTIEELGVLTARRDYAGYMKKLYPDLSPGEQQEIRNALCKYLVQKEAVQQIKRSLDATQALKQAQNEEKDSVLQQQLMNALGDQLDKMRAYPIDHPKAQLLLFIETTLNIKLRNDQIRNILKMDAAIQNGDQMVLQMIMGAGKTAVIQPILALLLARPDRLSTVMVPEALFQTVRESLATTLGSVADQMLVTLPYDVELSKDEKYLDIFLSRLQETQDAGGVFFISPRQQHSLITSLYEGYFSLSQAVTPDEKELLTRRVEKIAAILDFLQVNQEMQIDEIDMIKNPKVVFKRPIGDAITYDGSHVPEPKGSAKPQETPLEVVGRLFEAVHGGEEIVPESRPVQQFPRQSLLTELLIDVAMDENLNSRVSIDFCDALHGSREVSLEKSARKRGAAINEQLYYEVVQPEIVNKALALLKQKYPDHFGEQFESNPQNVEALKKFLVGEPPQGFEKVVQDPVMREVVASLASAITNIFPHSFLKECNTNYGKDPSLDASNPSARRYMARPYAAPNAPKPTSFADPLEKLSYTVQYYLYNGIPEHEAAKMLIDLQVRAKKEAIVYNCPLTKTPAYLEFMALNVQGVTFPVDPKSALFQDAVQKFRTAISKDKETLMKFMRHHVFEQNKVYQNSVMSTPQTVTGVSRREFGYTGTLHEAILSSGVQAVAEKGTDGKTITSMERKFQEGIASVEVAKEGSSLPQRVIQQFKDKDVFVFIDSGNWLKEERMRGFAERVLKESGRKDIEAIVYHNDRDELVCLEKKGNEYTEVPFHLSSQKGSPSKRLTIIRSKYETGTNIPQGPTAKAFMSVRKDMTLRDTLQSAFRMRGLLQGQSVSFMIADEVKSHMAQAVLEGVLSKIKGAVVEDEGKKYISKEALLKGLETMVLSEELKKQLTESLEDKEEKIPLLDVQAAFERHFVPDSGACWRYFAANLAKAELDKNWQAARYKMREAFEKPIRNILTNNDIPMEQRVALFQSVQTLLVQKTKETLFQLLLSGKREISREEAVEAEKNMYLAIYDRLASIGFTGLVEQAFPVFGLPYTSREMLEQNLYACVKLEDLAEKIEVRNVEVGGEQEMEAEIEQEAEVEEEQEQEVEAQLEAEAQVEEEREVAIDRVAPPEIKKYKKIGEWLDQQESMYDINSFYKKKFSLIATRVPLSLTMPDRNQIEFSDNLITSNISLQFEESAKNRLAARYMLVLQEGKKRRYVLVSHKDAELIKRGLVLGGLKVGRSAHLVSLEGEIIAGKGKLQDDETLKRIRVQSKFMMGKTRFDASELEILETIMRQNPGLRAQARTFYEECLRYRQEGSEQYRGSALEDLLNRPG